MSKKAYRYLRWPINNWPRYLISKTLSLYIYIYIFLSPDQFSWPLSSTKASKPNMIINQLGITVQIRIRSDTPASSLNFDWVNQGPTLLSALASISRSTDICGSRWSTRSEPPHQVTYIYTLYILLISGPVKGSNTTIPRIFDRCRIHSFLTFVPLPTEDLSKNATLASRSLFYANRTHHNFTRGNSIKRPMSRQQKVGAFACQSALKIGESRDNTKNLKNIPLGTTNYA